MNNSYFDVIIVGAGHAGLSASYYLKQRGLKHEGNIQHKDGVSDEEGLYFPGLPGCGSENQLP